MFNNNERGIRNNAVNPNAATTGTAAGAGATGGMTYGQSAASGPAPTTAGHHRHDVLNKLDPRIDSTRDHQPMAQTGSGVPAGTYGPHSSRIANVLDPRVDSDLSHTPAGAAGVGGAGAGVGTGAGVGMGTGRHHHHGGAATSTAVGAGAGYGAAHMAGGNNVPEGTYGPHSSRLANTLDPRVDSDRDRHVGPGATHAPGAAMSGRTGPATGMGVGGAGTGVGATGAGVGATTGAGPHSSKLMNKLDPRVDSTTGTWKPGEGPNAGAGAGAAGTRGTMY